MVILTPSKAATGNLSDWDYSAYCQRIRDRFARLASEAPVFTTQRTAELWDIFLDNLPGDQRQYHNCSTCRHFITRYGGLVQVDPDTGFLTSPIWDLDDVPDLYQRAVQAMRARITQASVDIIFYTKQRVLGQSTTGVWTHFSLIPPPALQPISSLHTVGQVMAGKREDFATLHRGISDYSLATLDSALHLLQSDALYRGEKVRGFAEWLHKVAKLRASGPSHTHHRRTNLIWLALAQAPPGWARPRSSVLGTLLDDLEGGMSYADAAARFKAKMHPLQYQRPQASPKTGNIDQAEKIVEKLGIASSLRRRFARFEELPAEALIWSPTVEPANPSKRNSIFAELREHQGISRVGDVPPTQTYTWAKFKERVLPTAKRILVRIPFHGAFCSVVTAADPDAPLIFQWGHPFSWYFYYGGSSCASWGLTTGAEVDVRGIVAKPLAWGLDPTSLHHVSDNAIFLLDGARDTVNPGLALFPETLKSDLHAVRSVIEAYSQRGKMEGAEEASACGILTVGVEVRVVTQTGHKAAYKIDRWD